MGMENQDIYAWDEWGNMDGMPVPDHLIPNKNPIIESHLVDDTLSPAEAIDHAYTAIVGELRASDMPEKDKEAILRLADKEGSTEKATDYIKHALSVWDEKSVEKEG